MGDWGEEADLSILNEIINIEYWLLLILLLLLDKVSSSPDCRRKLKQRDVLKIFEF